MRAKKHALSIFGLTMLTVGSVDSLRNLPATALFGSQLVAFFLLSAVFFLFPAALVSAELSSGWPQQGGIYVWVKAAWGKKVGFLAIWLQWISNVIWYPAILTFVAGSFGYLINPQLANNPYFLWGVIVVCFWGTTMINVFGMHASVILSNICVIFGLLIPMILLLGLGACWALGQQHYHVIFSAKSLLPHWQDRNLWVALTAIMLSFCGIEIATVHANDVEKPQHAFPRSLAYSSLIIISTLILGSLVIAIMIPQSEINLVAGIMQTFEVLCKTYHITWMMPVVSVMLVLGGLGGVSNWIIAPTKGLLIAAQDGYLPAVFQRMNKHGAPVVMLYTQAVLVTVLSGLYFFMPSVNGSYWLLTVLAAQLYMAMYFLMFLSAIKLRLHEHLQPRLFCIPGGFLTLLIVCLMGIFGVSLTVAIGFIPPTNINVGSTLMYECMLVVGLILLCLPPFLLRCVHKK